MERQVFGNAKGKFLQGKSIYELKTSEMIRVT